MIRIAEQFSRTPAGRVLDDGPDSGERFRKEFLVPALKSGPIVEILLDGTAGYPSSFLDAAFGGLIRYGDISKMEARKKIKLTFHDQEYRRHVDRIWSCIDDA